MRLLDSTIVPFCFRLNTSPMRFKELLNANKVYNDGMSLEHNIHGFKLRLGRAYMLFFSFLFVASLPFIGLFHSLFAHLNTHLLIIMTALITGSFFILFSLFKEYIIERAARTVIKKAWEKHLGLFEFEKYSALVAHYYGQAVEDEIEIGNLQRYIFDKISNNSDV